MIEIRRILSERWDGPVRWTDSSNGRWLDCTGDSVDKVAGGGTPLFNPMIAAPGEIDAEHCSFREGPATWKDACGGREIEALSGRISK